MSTTEKIARFIVDFQFDQIPAKGLEQAKISILDTIGTALVGAKGEIGTILARYVTEMGGNPQARLIGKGTKTSTPQAALANGTFAHADDYDDMASWGHAGAFLTAPLLALGEWLHLSGKKILEAYVVAFEVGYRLHISIGDIIQAGFHSSCLLGTMAAAAESAKLLGLDVHKTRATLGIAASLASGVMENFGTYTKPFHAGHASRNGVIAAILAREGLSANLNVLEGPRGFFYVFGQEQANIGRMRKNLGKSLAIVEEGVSIKPWPCCGGNHEALTAILQLIEKHDIKPDEVDSIEVATSWKPPGPLVRINPEIGFEGKFSARYNMALALIDRKIDLDSYTKEKFQRPEVHSLMKKVNYIQHQDCVDRPLRLQSESRFAVVTVKLKDGRVLSERQDAQGRKKLRGEEVYFKYRQNAQVFGLSADRINHSFELLNELEALNDINPLIDAVTQST